MGKFIRMRCNACAVMGLPHFKHALWYTLYCNKARPCFKNPKAQLDYVNVNCVCRNQSVPKAPGSMASSLSLAENVRTPCERHRTLRSKALDKSSTARGFFCDQETIKLSYILKECVKLFHWTQILWFILHLCSAMNIVWSLQKSKKTDLIKAVT